MRRFFFLYTLPLTKRQGIHFRSFPDLGRHFHTFESVSAADWVQKQEMSLVLKSSSVWRLVSSSPKKQKKQQQQNPESRRKDTQLKYQSSCKNRKPKCRGINAFICFHDCIKKPLGYRVESRCPLCYYILYCRPNEVVFYHLHTSQHTVWLNPNSFPTPTIIPLSREI